MPLRPYLTVLALCLGALAIWAIAIHFLLAVARP